LQQADDEHPFHATEARKPKVRRKVKPKRHGNFVFGRQTTIRGRSMPIKEIRENGKPGGLIQGREPGVKGWKNREKARVKQEYVRMEGLTMMRATLGGKKA